MRGPPKKTGPAAVRRVRAGSIFFAGVVSNPVDSKIVYPVQGFRSIGELVGVVLGSLREPTEAERVTLRAMWWRARRYRHTLPVEPGLIVFDGGGS